MRSFAMMRSSLAFALLLLASTATAGADNQPAQSGADPEKKICEKITVTGSRLATRTVCATQKEWERRRLEERQLLERSQIAACVETSVSAGHAQCHT